MTNLGAHSLDIADSCLGPLDVQGVTSAGGRFALEDNGETPDTQDALFEFKGWSASWSHREAAAGITSKFPLEFVGTKGTLQLSRSGFVVSPDRKIIPANAVPQFTGAHPVGGPQRVPEEGAPQFWCKATSDSSGNTREQFLLHARNFLDCVKSRNTPIADLESAHRVATLCHLANLSLRLGRKMRWDSRREDVIDDAEASRLLVRPYRMPWDATLKGLGVG
jgi:predicted dehydrogenase